LTPVLFPLRLAAALIATIAASSHALAADACLYQPPPIAGLVGAEAVADYRSTLLACRKGDEKRFAIRRMTIAASPWLLLVDPAAFTTTIESAGCWTCAPVEEDALKTTRYIEAVERSAETPGLVHRTFLRDAGLIHGATPGDFITGDLCPSHRPLDRRFFEKLKSNGAGTPVALSISGRWLKHHAADFQWLRAQAASGALDILWTNHTYDHPYAKGRPDDETFLLTKGVDPDYEILENERLLIANGGTPSIFFRFPGLVSSSPLMQAVRRHHLVSIGADSWLAKGQRPAPGSIVLVHPNGNEESGIDLFAKYYDNGKIARPLEPLAAAP
jgi:peptidoglycan/xylan/chitin deacetylase (PgdA/CDA1 family)